MVCINSNTTTNIWSQIWNLKVTKKVRVFVWLLQQEGLKTNQLLNKFHLKHPYCMDCTDTIETYMHALRDYGMDKQV